jgi:hypothetical protein
MLKMTQCDEGHSEPSTYPGWSTQQQAVQLRRIDPACMQHLMSRLQGCTKRDFGDFENVPKAFATHETLPSQGNAELKRQLH